MNTCGVNNYLVAFMQHRQADETPIIAVEQSYCPACGEPTDYCQGHGEISDIHGWTILLMHERDNHERCHPMGCEAAQQVSHGGTP